MFFSSLIFPLGWSKNIGHHLMVWVCWKVTKYFCSPSDTPSQFDVNQNSLITTKWGDQIFSNHPSLCDWKFSIVTWGQSKSFYRPRLSNWVFLVAPSWWLKVFSCHTLSHFWSDRKTLVTHPYNNQKYLVAILAYFLDGNIIFLMATKSGEGVCYMFLESHPIVVTKSSGNQIHFGCHSTRPIEFDQCKQIQYHLVKPLFLFSFSLPTIWVYLSLFFGFSPLCFAYFLASFFPTPLLFCFHIFFIHSLFILFYFIPPFVSFLWFLTSFLFCFPYFVFALCFFPFFYCSHPPFPSFFFLPFFLPFAFSLANIPLFLLLFHALPPIAFLGNWKNSVTIG